MDLASLGAAPVDPFADAGAAVGGGTDPFADAEADSQQKDLIHIRVQQRNGRKCITTVQGLDQQLDLKKISKTIKKAHCCNGSIVEDEDMGQVLQFQGDQRDAVMNFLTENGAPPNIPASLPTASTRSARLLPQTSAPRTRSRSTATAERAAQASGFAPGAPFGATASTARPSLPAFGQ